MTTCKPSYSIITYYLVLCPMPTLYKLTEPIQALKLYSLKRFFITGLVLFAYYTLLLVLVLYDNPLVLT